MKDMDNEIKQVLEARRIPPSNSSWDKLANKLDQEKNKPRKKMRWLRIAAVFLGGILIGALVFNQKENALDENSRLVNENNANFSEETSNDMIKKPFVVPNQENIPTAIAVSGTKKATVKKTQQVVERIGHHPGDAREKAEKEKRMANLAQAAQKEDKTIVNQQEGIFTKPGENKAITEVSDAEIEKLLHEATLKIERQAFFTRPKNDVNAQALLQNTEKELKRPYKDRVFDYVQDKLIQLSSTSRIFN